MSHHEFIATNYLDNIYIIVVFLKKKSYINKFDTKISYKR